MVSIPSALDAGAFGMNFQEYNCTQMNTTVNNTVGMGSINVSFDVTNESMIHMDFPAPNHRFSSVSIMVKVYYPNNDLYQTYSYKLVPAGLNDTEFQIAFAAAKPVFAGDVNPDMRSSFPLQAYNMAKDVYGDYP